MLSYCQRAHYSFILQAKYLTCRLAATKKKMYGRKNKQTNPKQPVQAFQDSNAGCEARDESRK